MQFIFSWDRFLQLELVLHTAPFFNVCLRLKNCHEKLKTNDTQFCDFPLFHACLVLLICTIAVFDIDAFRNRSNRQGHRDQDHVKPRLCILVVGVFSLQYNADNEYRRLR